MQEEEEESENELISSLNLLLFKTFFFTKLRVLNNPVFCSYLYAFYKASEKIIEKGRHS